jgi:hypothetical protein
VARAGVVAQQAAGVQAAHPGHLDVEDDQVEFGGVGEDGLQRRLAVGRDDHVVTLGDQDPLDQVADVRIVIC